MIMGDGFPFDILFLGLVVAYLILQLRKVLGRRTGHEKPPPDVFSRDRAEKEEKGDNIIQLPEGEYEAVNDVEPSRDDAAKEEAPQQTDDEKTITGLKDILAADEAFDADGFLQGASDAFEMIIEAFATADKSTLRSLLSDDVYDDFMSAIKAREKSGEILENSLVGLKSAEILEASLNGRIAALTVKLVSEQISVTRNAEGEVIDGDPEHIVQMVDIWTFSRNLRSRDLNWTLVETRSQN